jgi:hypothetical protein
MSVEIGGIGAPFVEPVVLGHLAAERQSTAERRDRLDLGA